MRPRYRRAAKWLIPPILLLVLGEVVARYHLGLGDPPLSQADPAIEYLFKPDQDCRRFGNRIRYNHYSMRSPDFPPRKVDPAELRILVLGDSVINGGVQTDQAALATTLLQARLAADLHRPVVVGNVSAGSWGPPNLLAYLRKFGLFDADVVVVVLSSHDAYDVPTFEPVVGVSPAVPNHKPPLALWEGFERYLLPRFKSGPANAAIGDSGPAATTAPARQADVDASLLALREIIAIVKKSGAVVIVAQHLESGEGNAGTSMRFGHEQIADAARQSGVDALVDLGAPFRAAAARGENPYRDPIHPNAVGQQVIAEALRAAIAGRVR